MITWQDRVGALVGYMLILGAVALFAQPPTWILIVLVAAIGMIVLS